MEREVVYRTPKELRRRKNAVDVTLPVIMVLLLQCGLLTLFSATFYKAVSSSGDSLLEVKRQLIGIGLGAVLMFITNSIQNGLIYLLLALLISPIGLPALADHLLNGLDFVLTKISDIAC